MDPLFIAGLSLLSTIIDLIRRAVSNDPTAQQKLRRVEEVLTDSPTARVWADALERAKAKPETLPQLAAERAPVIAPLAPSVSVWSEPPPNPFDGSDEDGA